MIETGDFVRYAVHNMQIQPLSIAFKVGSTTIVFDDQVELYLKTTPGCVNITTKNSFKRTGGYTYRFFTFDSYEGYEEYFSGKLKFQEPLEIKRTKLAFFYRITERQKTPIKKKFPARPITTNVLLVP